ncbi:hypothetical protein [Micromonospora sp. IBHARD004]
MLAGYALAGYALVGLALVAVGRHGSPATAGASAPGRRPAEVTV